MVTKKDDYKKARNAFIGIGRRSFMVVLRPRDAGGWNAEAMENESGKLRPFADAGFAAGRDAHEALGHAVAAISRKIEDAE